MQNVFKQFLMVSMVAHVFLCTHARASSAGNSSTTIASKKAVSVLELAGNTTEHLKARESGAIVVIGRSALVHGDTNAAFTVQPMKHEPEGNGPKARFSLESGGVHILVGGEPIILKLGNYEITLAQTTVTAIKVQGGWALAINAVETDETIETIETTDSPLKSRSASFVSENETPVAASSTQLAMLNELVGRLTAPKNTPPLSYVSVEDPADRNMFVSDRGNIAESLEIEAIEVEAGCVEICVD